MAEVKELYFNVSGEHQTLPYAEIKAILEANGFPYKNTMLRPRFLCIESNPDCLKSVVDRSSLTKACGIVILRCTTSKEGIVSAIKEIDYNKFIRGGQTYSIETIILTTKKLEINLQNTIGKEITKQIPDIKANLKNPDISFMCILFEDVFILGIKIRETSRIFLRRKLNQQPFIHPSAMKPKLARLIVNLARTKIGDLVLDPFCGTGSILAEAGSIGCRILGSDINIQMIRGTMRNLNYSGIMWDGLVASEAGQLPFDKVNHIVTDPPYGRTSSTHGLSTKEIVMDFLIEALRIIPKGGYISIVLPDTLNMTEISKEIGYTNIESHLLREHKSLTREISVLLNS